MIMGAAHYLRTAEAAVALIAAPVRIALLRIAPLDPSDMRRDARGHADSAVGDMHDLSPAADPTARAVALAVHAASRRFPWHPTCLEQALAARAMLRRRGIRSALRFGVMRDAGELKAHAWLVSRGAIVIGAAEAGKYQSLRISMKT